MGGGSWRPTRSNMKYSGASANTPNAPAPQKTIFANFIPASIAGRARYNPLVWCPIRNFARWGGWVDEVVESLVHRSSSGVGQIRMADFQAQMRLKARWGSGWGARNGRRKQWEVIPVRTRSGRNR